MDISRSLVALSTLAALPLLAADPIRWEPLCEPGGGGCIVSLAISPRDPLHIVSGGDMLSAAVSFDGGDSWTPCQGFTSYEMGTPTFHPERPDELWFGSCMGPFRSADGGRTWESRRNGMPASQPGRYTAIVETVLAVPGEPDRLLAFGGSSRHWNQCDAFGWIWESRDDGATWKHLGTLADKGFTSTTKKGANITRAFFGPDGALNIVADGIGWWQSLDKGATWRRMEAKGTVGGIIGITFRPGDARTVWATTDSSKGADGKRVPGGVFKSTDGGATFARCEKGLTKIENGDGNHASKYTDVAVSPAAPDELYVCDQSWSHNVVYKSDDGGASWHAVATRTGIGEAERDVSGAARLETATFAGPALRLVAAPSARGRVYGFNSEYIARTLDGGKTWDDATAFRPDPAKPDAWRGRGWNGWCCTDFEFNPWRKGQSVALMMDAGRGWISDDGLLSWRYTMGQTHPWLGGNAVGFSRDGHIYITTGQFGNGNGIQHSADSGATWTTLAGAKHGLPDAGWSNGKTYGGIYVHPEDGRKAWAVLDGGMVATVDGGETWRAVDGISGASQIARDPSKAGRFYVKTRAGVLVTEDGRAFENIGLATNDSRGRINCDAKGRVLACLWREGRHGLWRYDPADARWTRLLDDYHAMECNADPSDPTRLLLVTSEDPFYDDARGNGVWISTDDGASWSPANDGLPMLRLNACAFDPFDPECIVAGCYGAGFVRARWSKDFRPKGTRRFTPKDEFAVDRSQLAVSATANREPQTANREATTEPVLVPVVVRNGGMTQGGASVAEWHDSIRDTEVFKEGPASLRVDAKGVAYQRIEGMAGKRIRLAGWMKTSGKARAQVAVQSFAKGYSQNKWQQLIYRQDNSDWSSFNKEIELPEWTEWSEIKLLVEGESGSAWLDEVRDANGAVDAGKPVTEGDEIRSAAPPRGKPWEPAWCIYGWRAGWAGMHDGFKARSAKGGVDILALGDSIMQGWGDRVDAFAKSIDPSLTGANYGIGGDSTRQLIWRIQHDELKGLSPKVVLVGIGTNNLYDDVNGGSEDEIVRGVSEALSLLRKALPESRIILLSILPRQNDWFCNRIYPINAKLAKLADGKQVFWHDRTDVFQNGPADIKAELFGDDRLHLKAASYDVWEKDLAPVVRRVLP